MKTAIVVSGGGMASSYITGALVALVEKYNIKTPDIIIGGSGSAAPIAYYTSQQYEFLKEWINKIPTKKVINFLRFWKILDINFLINTFFKKTIPLNTKKVKSSKTELIIGAFEQDTGKIKYFSSKKDNILKAIKATKSIPILTKPVKIKNHKYNDSFLSCSVKLNIIKCIEKNIKTIIVIHKGEANFKGKLQRIPFYIWLFLKGKKVFNTYMKKRKQEQNYKIPSNIKIITITPKKPFDAYNLTRDKKILKYLYKQGYKDALNNKELKKIAHRTK